MKALGLILLLVLPQFASALSVDYPTIDINGVKHYLADYDDSTSEWFGSGDGYCVTQGFQYFGSIASVIDSSLKPLVVLDPTSGQVVQTLPDNKADQVWVIANITCN